MYDISTCRIYYYEWSITIILPTADRKSLYICTRISMHNTNLAILSSWCCRYELYAKYTVNRATSLSYLMTWSPEVWAAFLLTMFLIVVCMWLVTNIRYYPVYSNTTEHDNIKYIINNINKRKKGNFSYDIQLYFVFTNLLRLILYSTK